METVVAEEDVSFLLEKLSDYAYKWKDIGRALGFSHGEVKNINQGLPKGDPSECFVEILNKWSQWPTTRHEEKPTLERLCEALRTTAVGLGAAANDLYSGKNDLPSLQPKKLPTISSEKARKWLIWMCEFLSPYRTYRHGHPLFLTLCILFLSLFLVYLLKVKVPEKDHGYGKLLPRSTATPLYQAGSLKVKIPEKDRDYGKLSPISTANPFFSSQLKKHHQSQSLPFINHKLIGRESEKSDIIESLRERNLVILYGVPGFGKSEIILHIGHEILESGYDVHYIRVEEFTSVEGLQRKLENITGIKFERDKPMKLTSNNTLLILDNVDGIWKQSSSRKRFMDEFVDVLLRFSHLKILITSQEAVTSSNYRYDMHKLQNLSTDGCVSLYHYFLTHDSPTISTRDAKEICELVGNVPLVIKVLAQSLYGTDFIIGRLKESMPNRQEFLSGTNNRIWSALNISFQSMKKEHRVCSLLLVKFPFPFHLSVAKRIVTSNVMKKYTDHFLLEECVTELYKKSFIEKRATKNYWLKSKTDNIYSFHEQIRGFLEMSVEEINVTDNYWMNYLNSFSPSDFQFFLSRQDIHQLNDIISRHNEHSYNISISIINKYRSIKWHSFKPCSFDHPLRVLLNSSVKVLTTFCKKPIYDTIKIRELTFAYQSLIAYDHSCFVSSYDEYLEKLWICLEKFEEIFKRKNEYWYIPLLITSNNFYELCTETKKRHAICYDHWKLYLSFLSRDLDIQLKKYQVPLNKTESILLGVLSYYSMEYNKSLYHLQHALKENYNCKDSLDPVAHILLYSIYTSRDDLKSANESLTAITRTRFQCSNVVCYFGVYRDLVIPFLLSVNQTQLVVDLSQLVEKCQERCEIECRNSLLHSYAFLSMYDHSLFD